MSNPLKRHKALQPLSREHHLSLLFSWKIRTGLFNSVEINRMKNYADWFYKHHIQPHFKMEEKWVFPILGNEHEMVKKALTEHRRLHRLFNDAEEPLKSLSLLEEELESHIRFEERILFPEIQKQATTAELEQCERMHTEIEIDQDWCDRFWEKNT